MSSENSRLTPRPHRNTLETFNDELAILDRPIEGDIEYYDEPPPTCRLRVGAVAVATFLLAGGGFLALSRHRTAVLSPVRWAQAVAQPGAPPTAVASGPPRTEPMPTATAQTATARTATARTATARTATARTATTPAAIMRPAARTTTAPTAATALAEGPTQTDEVPAMTSPAPRAAWAKNGGRHGHRKHGSAGDRSSRRHGRRRG